MSAYRDSQPVDRGTFVSRSSGYIAHVVLCAGTVRAMPSNSDEARDNDSCTFVWNPSGLTLVDLASLTSLLTDLHNKVAVPYVIEQAYQSGSNVPRKSLRWCTAYV